MDTNSKINVFDLSNYTVDLAAIQTYGLMVDALFKKMPNLVMDMLHCAVGISGEIAELHDATTHENYEEELGDAMFYYTKLRDLLGLPPIAPLDVSLSGSAIDGDEIMRRLHVISGEILDQVKKAWVYERTIDFDKLRDLCETWYTYWHAAISRVDTSVDKVIVNNVRKLSKRYPDGVYTNAHANARLDKAG